MHERVLEGQEVEDGELAVAVEVGVGVAGHEGVHEAQEVEDRQHVVAVAVGRAAPHADDARALGERVHAVLGHGGFAVEIDMKSRGGDRLDTHVARLEGIRTPSGTKDQIRVAIVGMDARRREMELANDDIA